MSLSMRFKAALKALALPPGSILARHAPLDPAAASHAGAIVILGGGVAANAPEFGEPVMTGSRVAGCRHGAKLHRDTGLPPLLTGGEAMQQFLTAELGIGTLWLAVRR